MFTAIFVPHVCGELCCFISYKNYEPISPEGRIHPLAGMLLSVGHTQVLQSSLHSALSSGK